MQIKEWMSMFLLCEAHNWIKPLNNYPVPHHNRSHKCGNCGFIWELIENPNQLVIPDLFKNEINLMEIQDDKND